jgi:hypothetical protein
MSLTKEDWVALRGKRADITSALHALGIPHDGWINERPDFKQGYEPNWVEIENIATAVNVKGAKEWPPYIKKTAKVVEKAKAPKKVARAVKK